MKTFSLGPTVTYVTDPGLTLAEQKRVLRDVMRAANGYMLRVAFRLPRASDDDIRALIDWYRDEETDQPLVDGLQPPLFHHRPRPTDYGPEPAVWAPARFLDTGVGAYAYSVHNPEDVKQAISAGANEVIYGHVFETESHPGEQSRGVAGLLRAGTALAGNRTVTLTAIGGIDEESIRVIGRAGVGSVASIRAISRSSDIPATLRVMHQNWNSGYAEFLEKGQLQ